MKAVVRNRVRRSLREIVRRAPVRKGWDQLLIARRSIAEADFQTIRQVVLGLERRLDLLEKPGNDKAGG
jgi:ribonuclease P protein component